MKILLKAKYLSANKNIVYFDITIPRENGKSMIGVTAEFGREYEIELEEVDKSVV